MHAGRRGGKGLLCDFVTFTIHCQGLGMKNELTFFLKDTSTHTHINSKYSNTVCMYVCVV